MCIVNHLMINDSVTILSDFANNKNEYFVNLPIGSYQITSAWGYKYTLIDTIVTFDENKTITLTTNNIRDFWQREFQNDFCKVYSNGGETPIIGLKDDETFLFKRFIHLGYVAYFLFESGSYSIKNDILILNVNNYHPNPPSETDKTLYSYEFAIKNEDVIHIDKYGMEVGAR